MTKPLPDRDLWLKVTESIKPLANKARTAVPTANPPRCKKAAAPDLAKNYIPQAPARPSDLNALHSKAAAAGVDTNTQKRLRAGELAVEARLDLHGHTLATAHPALVRFIHHHYRLGKRCVLLITGRSGKLRQEVPRWLNEAELRPYLIALSSAQTRHGGEGALYVLLKRQR